MNKIEKFWTVLPAETLHRFKIPLESSSMEIKSFKSDAYVYKFSTFHLNLGWKFKKKKKAYNGENILKRENLVVK